MGRFGPRGNFRSKWSTSRGGPLWPVGPVRPKLAVPFPKILVSSPTLLDSSQNFGRNVNGSLDSTETLFQLKNVFPDFLLIIPLVSNWLVWQNGKHAIWTFFGVQFWVPWGTCPLNRGPPKERNHCIVTTLSASPPPPVYSYQKRFQSPVVWPKAKTVTLVNW